MTRPLRLVESAFAHYLPYWHVEDGALVLHDGAVVLGFRLQGIDPACQTDEYVNAIAHQLRATLNALPVGYQLQLLRRSRPLGEQQFSEYAKALKTDDAILREQRGAALDHLRGQRLRRFETYLFLSKPRALGPLGSHIGSPMVRVLERALGRRDPYALTREQHDAAVVELAQQSQLLLRGFAATGVKAVPMDDEALVEVAYGILNPGDDARPGLLPVDPPESLVSEQRHLYRALSLREQLVHTPMNWDVDSFTLGDPMRLHRVMGLGAGKSLPRRTTATLIKVANRIDFDHWLSVGVAVPDSEKKYDEVETRRNRARSAAAGYARNVRASEQADELESVLQQMNRDQRIFALSLNVLFSADSLAQLDERTRQVTETFRQMSGSVVHTEQMAQLPVFLGMLPGNAHAAPRKRTLLTDNAADLLPVYDAWGGDARPTFLVKTREGEPVNIDLTDPRRTNWNATVFGGSGGGKTFLTLSLATSSMLGQGSPLIVIDVGGKELGSYYRLNSLLGGDFVDLSLDGANCINPFYSRSDLYTDGEGRSRTIPDELKLAFLVGITKLLVTEPGRPPLTRVEEGLLQRAIHAAYSRLGDERPPIFSDVVAELEVMAVERPERESARGFAKTLKAWLDGPYGKLINQQSKVNVRSNFVVFDLKGLESIGDLASVILLIVSAYVWNMISRPRSELAWVVYDECWKLLMNDTAAALQSELYRTARKLKTGVVSITQKLEDFLAAPSAKAVLSNTTTTFLLKHKDGHEKVAEMLSMNERELELFRGLKSEKGFYSEFFLKQENGSAVCRYAPSPFEYWVNSTDPKDRELEAKVLRQVGGDRLSALQQLARTHPNGASAGPVQQSRQAASMGEAR